jgi:hypothetical protein
LLLHMTVLISVCVRILSIKMRDRELVEKLRIQGKLWSQLKEETVKTEKLNNERLVTLVQCN